MIQNRIPPPLRGGRFRYGTAGTTTTTPLSSSGGLLVNIDSATGGIPITANGWVEDEKYGFYSGQVAVGWSTQFDTTVKKTGTKSLKLSTTSTTGRQRTNTFSAVAGASGKDLFPIKISTKYKLGVWVKTNNITAGNTILFFSTNTQNPGYALNLVNTITLTAGTADWTYYSAVFTSNGTDTFAGIQFRLDTAGNVSDYWVDVNSMTLEEVVEPVATIFDQSFTTAPTGTSPIGNNGGLQTACSQGFTPTISNNSGVILYKSANVGTPTGNMKVDIQTDNAGKPSGTVIATTTIPLATYNAMPVGEFVVNFGYNLTIGTLYHIVISNTATEALNTNFRLSQIVAGGYTGGSCNFSTDGMATWSALGTQDFYFRTFNSPLTSSSPSLVSFTAVGSMDNIDQSLDTGGAFVNTYTLTTAVNEGATHIQTFVPTKSKLARIGVWVVAKGTGNWTLVVHDSSNVVQATATIANASLTNGAFNYFTLPANLTAGATYHFHVYSTVADGTVKANTASDLETCSFIHNYYKPTTNFKASQNNSTVSISAGNEEGFIEGSVMNLTTGAWSFTDPVNDGAIQNNMYFDRHVGTTFSGNTVVFAGANRYYILKINTGLPMVGDLVYTVGFITNNTFTYSYDNVSYNSLGTLVGSGGSYNIPMTGYSTVYIKNNANAAGSMTNHSATGTLNLSSLSTLRNYPTNKDIIKQYSTTLGSATTSATYRATKWGFPAIEYSSTEYQFLDVDTTTTGSTVAFSELGSSYTTVADGASIAISSTSTPSIFVKANITANRIYVSSNDLNASSDKDGSLKQTFTYKVMQ